VNVILKGSAQLGYAPHQNVITNKRIWPACLQELFFGQGLAGVSCQAHKDFHYLGLQSSACTALGDAIQARLYEPSGKTEVTIHCSSSQDHKLPNFRSAHCLWIMGEIRPASDAPNLALASRSVSLRNDFLKDLLERYNKTLR